MWMAFKPLKSLHMNGLNIEIKIYRLLDFFLKKTQVYVINKTPLLQIMSLLG